MKYLKFIILILGSLLVLSSCSNRGGELSEDQKQSEKPEIKTYEISKTQFDSSGLKFGRFEMTSFNEILKSNGMLTVPPEKQISVNSYFGGAVKNLRLLPGEKVKKGQLLFQLENPDFVQIQQEYLEAKGQLIYLKSDYERQQNLAKDNVSSQKNYNKAESDYTITRVRFESLALKLKLMNIDPNTLTFDKMRTSINIFSPINGFVTQINISNGVFLNPSQTALSIIDGDKLHLALKIFENDLAKVNIGQQIKFRIQEVGNVEYDAEVFLINKIVDPGSRTISVFGKISDNLLDKQFYPGMYIEADIISPSISRLALPESAVVDMEGKFFVLTLKDSINNSYHLQTMEIKPGQIGNGYVEILNHKSFNDSTIFLINGSFNLITE